MLFSGIRTSRTRLGFALFCTSSAIALSSAASAQGTAPETVVVTSSRVIADAANSPTPLTIVTTAQLETTTPGNLGGGLNKLPAFIGSFSTRTFQNASANFGSDSLNLRAFGAERTLVLFDGKRVVSSNPDNTVDIDSLPQMLVQRVDVVTGGASAVYGSDAITGVVNFILDKHFVGWKFDANAGISNYNDGSTYNIGVAAGSDLFGGRGHIEGAVRATHADQIPVSARPWGTSYPVVTGAGTAANPFTTSVDVRLTGLAYGGKITCTGCAANGQQFIANGILGPFNPGLTTGTNGDNIGGDGTHAVGISMAPLTANEQSFLRFSYNLNDDATFYVQGAVNQSYSKANFQANYITTGATASTFYYNNPYLSATAQAALKGSGAASTFTLNTLFANQGSWGNQVTAAIENTQSVTAGLDGAWGRYNWSVFYTHGDARVKVSNPHNQNLQLMWAANDGVAGPAAGQVQCYVSTTTYSSLYPGCVPINPFGPTALTSAQYNYFLQDTFNVQTNTLDDIGGSFAGDLFDNWAGPVKAALSGEARWMSLSINSSVAPGFVNCTGLRLCNTQSATYAGTVVASLPEVSENVWEFAGEVNIPLLKNLPLVQDLNLDVAGRYTDYSVSGSVETWKIGLDYHVNDEVRFRATNSVDIRAPSLYDLYQPLTISHGSFNDAHTNSAPQINLQTQGNSNLTPEVSRTYTAGVVFTPEFIPGLTTSIDYYHMNMTNVLTSVSGQNTAIQSICEASGGTSPYCSLFVRPLPFSNTTTNNAPSTVISEALNVAFQRTEGWDIELDYNFQLGDVWANVPGTVNLRMLANIQPMLESVPFPSSPVNFTATKEVYIATALPTTAKGHVTSFLSYDVGSWSFNLQDRWMSGYPKAPYYGLIYAQPRINSVNYQDITIDKKFTIGDQTLDGYFSVQNVGNIAPPLNAAGTTGNPGIYPDGLSAFDRTIFDTVGRFFTLGVRARF